AQIARFAERLGQLVEVGFDHGDRAGLAGEVEQGTGVTPCQASLDTGGKLHAKGSSWVRRTEIFSRRCGRAEAAPARLARTYHRLCCDATRLRLMVFQTWHAMAA